MIRGSIDPVIIKIWVQSRPGLSKKTKDKLLEAEAKFYLTVCQQTDDHTNQS